MFVGWVAFAKLTAFDIRTDVKDVVTGRALLQEEASKTIAIRRALLQQEVGIRKSLLQKN